MPWPLIWSKTMAEETEAKIKCELCGEVFDEGDFTGGLTVEKSGKISFYVECPDACLVAAGYTSDAVAVAVRLEQDDG